MLGCWQVVCPLTEYALVHSRLHEQQMPVVEERSGLAQVPHALVEVSTLHCLLHACPVRGARLPVVCPDCHYAVHSQMDPASVHSVLMMFPHRDSHRA